MDIRRILPYISGLVVLAFALGSLVRSTSGGSLIFRSYWLLYLVYLGPPIVLAAMIGLIVLIALNWREIGAGIGFGIANRKKARKRNTLLPLIISMTAWAVAFGYLISTKQGIFGDAKLPDATAIKIVGENGSVSNPFQSGAMQTISGFVQTSWFSFAFLGLLGVATLVVVQAIKVSLRETGQLDGSQGGRQLEGLQAVNEAIKLVDDPDADPRSRVISSYQRLVVTVSNLGTPAGPEMTARELERAICSTLLLKGSATKDLTQLFEEARYSLHEITSEDAGRAHYYLHSIASELRIQLDSL